MAYKSLYLIFLLLFTGCATSGPPPEDIFSNIQSRSDIKTYSNASEVVKNETALKAKDFSFSEKGPFVVENLKKVPFQFVKFSLAKPQDKYIILASQYRYLELGKQGIVFPELAIYGEDNKVIKAQKVLIGDDSMCGLWRCVKTVFEVSQLPAEVRILITPSAQTVGKDISRVSQTSYAPNVGTITTGATMYSDVIGNVSLSSSHQLPRLSTVFYEKK